MNRLWLTEIVKDGVCTGVRNRGCEDWAGSTQGVSGGGFAPLTAGE